MEPVLKVMRDPLFAVGLSVVLAVLATRVGGCLVKVVLAAGSIAAFVWLLVSFQPFENFVVAVLGVVATVLVVLVISVAVIAVVAVVAVYVMHREETRRPRRLREARDKAVRTETEYSDDEEIARLERWRDDLDALDTRLMNILESLVDTDDDPGLSQSIGRVVSAYFSGLSPHLPDIRRIGEDCDRVLLDLARHLPSSFTGVDTTRLLELASSRTYLPSRDELEEWSDEEIPWYGYWAVRVLCVNRRWRATATVYAKVQYGKVQVLRCFEALI
ncbi:hypothetical protein [Lentzea cavernae]|uniref:Uncharacterized protein n=1 Tax=Lentzea cavernae TaxID=2020703 RepID=A0ABQ3MEM7_9PSEU|nr:hypothetical protein [Lentzea cavernae]GHH39946.1 hypothetical protein GCM10017774_32470 [Lentzea cavernae]